MDHAADRIHLFSTSEDQVTAVEPYRMENYDEVLQNFYAQNHVNPLFEAAMLFREKPYLFEALGEGPDAPYSEEPLYRTDKFDCVTYVNTILALANSKNLTEFKKNIIAIRYRNHLPINYINRTDWFTDLEWLPNARQLGWIGDVTLTIVDKKQQPIALTAETIIDKRNWFRVKPLKTMHLLSSVASHESLLSRLRAEGEAFQPQSSQISYLPFDQLFDADESPNPCVFNQLPSVSLIVMVRPNWQIRDNFPGFPQGYGTNLNVSHLGILFRMESDLLFCHASSVHKKVVCVSFIEYLKTSMQLPGMEGIHVERIKGVIPIG